MFLWWPQRCRRPSRNTHGLLRSRLWTNICYLSKAGHMAEPRIRRIGYYIAKGLNPGRVKNQRHHSNPCSHKKRIMLMIFVTDFFLLSYWRHKLQFSLQEAKTYSLISRQWYGNYQGMKLKLIILYGLESALQSSGEEFPWKIRKKALYPPFMQPP